MRFFVYSRSYPQQKLYVNFGRDLATRGDIKDDFFAVADYNGVQQYYTRNDVFAEVGPEPAGAALIIGALLFIIDPVIGLLGGALGGLFANQAEQDKVKQFNESF